MICAAHWGDFTESVSFENQIKVFIFNLLEPISTCQYFLCILAETTFSPHILLSQRLKESTNVDVIYSSPWKTTIKLPIRRRTVRPEAIIYKGIPHKISTYYLRCTNCAKPSISTISFNYHDNHTRYMCSLFQFYNQKTKAKELRPNLLCVSRFRSGSQGHVIPCLLHEGGSNIQEKPLSRKGEGKKTKLTHTHLVPGLLSQKHPDFCPGLLSSTL